MRILSMCRVARLRPYSEGVIFRRRLAPLGAGIRAGKRRSREWIRIGSLGWANQGRAWLVAHYGVCHR